MYLQLPSYICWDVFFARRGIPKTITSDIAPTFILGETILNQSIQAAVNDPSITWELTNREITWKHITPHAPWQGGVYERLIKSVEESLYKTLGKNGSFFRGIIHISDRNWSTPKHSFNIHFERRTTISNFKTNRLSLKRFGNFLSN